MGDHTHGTHQLPRLWPLILTPYISQKPLFLSTNCHPKSCFFPHCPKFWKLFTQRPQIGWKKGTQMPPIFMAFVTERPPIFCLACKCLRGMLLPQTWSEAGKFCILETELCNLVNTCRCKFNKGDENKISDLQAQSTQLLWKNFIGGQGWYTGHHTRSNTEGDISYNHPLYDSAPPGSLNKCQVYLKLCEQRHFKCKVQCRALWRARENFKI